MDEKYRKKLTPNDKNSTLNSWRILLLVVGGFFVGVVSGLFGGGGGTVVIPLIVSIGLLRDREAHATSIAIILPIALVSAIVYLVMGTRADYHAGVMTILGVFGGGLIGTFLLRKLKVNILKIAFYIIMIVAGVKMIIGN